MEKPTTFLSVERGTRDYYLYLTATLFHGYFDRQRFLSVAERILKLFNIPVERIELERHFQSLNFWTEVDNRVELSADYQLNDLIRSMDSAVLLDALGILRTLARSLKVPWLFLSTGQSLGKFAAISPAATIPVLAEFSRSDSIAHRQAAAIACRTTAAVYHPYKNINIILDIIQHLLADPNSEEVRKFARKAVGEWGLAHARKVSAVLLQWAQDPDHHVRQSVALILREPFVDERTAETLSERLQSDPDERIRHSASESKKHRGGRQLSLNDLDSRVQQIWSQTDEAIFCAEITALKQELPGEYFWDSIRRVVFKPLVQAGDFEPIHDAAIRLRSSYPQLSNILLSVSPVILDEWTQDPEKVQRLLANWYLAGKGRTFFTQVLRNRGHEFAVMLSDAFSEMYRAAELPNSDAVLGMLDNLVLGKISTPAGYKSKVRKNLAFVFRRLYEHDNEKLETYLVKWLDGEDLNAVDISVSTIVQLAAENQADVMPVLRDALRSKNRERVRVILETLGDLALDRRYESVVLRFAYALMKDSRSLLRSEAANCIGRIENLQAANGRSSLKVLETICAEDGILIPNGMRLVWEPYKLVRLITQHVLGRSGVKELFDLCKALQSQADGRPDRIAKKILESYRTAIDNPKKELSHLYEIRDAFKELGSDEHVKNLLDLSKTKWSTFGRLANHEPLIEGRHVGQSPGPLRHATEAELTEARSIARHFIQRYIDYQQGGVKTKEFMKI